MNSNTKDLSASEQKKNQLLSFFANLRTINETTPQSTVLDLKNQCSTLSDLFSEEYNQCRDGFFQNIEQFKSKSQYSPEIFKELLPKIQKLQQVLSHLQNEGEESEIQSNYEKDELEDKDIETKIKDFLQLCRLKSRLQKYMGVLTEKKSIESAFEKIDLIFRSSLPIFQLRHDMMMDSLNNMMQKIEQEEKAFLELLKQFCQIKDSVASFASAPQILQIFQQNNSRNSRNLSFKEKLLEIESKFESFFHAIVSRRVFEMYCILSKNNTTSSKEFEAVLLESNTDSNSNSNEILRIKNYLKKFVGIFFEEYIPIKSKLQNLLSLDIKDNSYSFSDFIRSLISNFYYLLISNKTATTNSQIPVYCLLTDFFPSSSPSSSNETVLANFLRQEKYNSFPETKNPQNSRLNLNISSKTELRFLFENIKRWVSVWNLFLTFIFSSKQELDNDKSLYLEEIHGNYQFEELFHTKNYLKLFLRETFFWLFCNIFQIVIKFPDSSSSQIEDIVSYFQITEDFLNTDFNMIFSKYFIIPEEENDKDLFFEIIQANIFNPFIENYQNLEKSHLLGQMKSKFNEMKKNYPKKLQTLVNALSQKDPNVELINNLSTSGQEEFFEYFELLISDMVTAQNKLIDTTFQKDFNFAFERCKILTKNSQTQMKDLMENVVLNTVCVEFCREIEKLIILPMEHLCNSFQSSSLKRIVSKVENIENLKQQLSILQHQSEKESNLKAQEQQIREKITKLNSELFTSIQEIVRRHSGVIIPMILKLLNFLYFIFSKIDDLFTKSKARLPSSSLNSTLISATFASIFQKVSNLTENGLKSPLELILKSFEYQSISTAADLIVCTNWFAVDPYLGSFYKLPDIKPIPLEYCSSIVDFIYNTLPQQLEVLSNNYSLATDGQTFLENSSSNLNIQEFKKMSKPFWWLNHTIELLLEQVLNKFCSAIFGFASTCQKSISNSASAQQNFSISIWGAAQLSTDFLFLKQQICEMLNFKPERSISVKHFEILNALIVLLNVKIKNEFVAKSLESFAVDVNLAGDPNMNMKMNLSLNYTLDSIIRALYQSKQFK